MNLPFLLAIMLLTASPATAQYNTENNCIRNKKSEMQRVERLYQSYYQFALKPENMVEIAKQIEEDGQFSKDLSQAEKNGIAYKLMTDQLTQMKSQLELYRILPDCSELQGGISH